MTTDRRRRAQGPLRASAAPARIISTALAIAACVGVIGIIGIRTMDNKPSNAVETTASTAPAPSPEPTSGTLTREQLDQYAASLAAEKARLDAYRAKLTRAAERLKQQAAKLEAAKKR